MAFILKLSTQRKYVLTCTQCGATADLRNNLKAWNGWMVAPEDICPACIKADLESKGYQLVKSEDAGFAAHWIRVGGE